MKENIWISGEQLNLIEVMINEQNALLKDREIKYFQLKKRFLEKYKKVWLVQKWFDKKYQDMKAKLDMASYQYSHQKSSSEMLIQIYFHITDIVAIYQMIFESIAREDQILTKAAYVDLQLKFNMFYAMVDNLKFKIGFENSLIRTNETLKHMQETADELFNEENYNLIDYSDIGEFIETDIFSKFLTSQEILEKAIAESWHYEDYQKIYLAYKKYQKQQLLDEKKSLLQIREQKLFIKEQSQLPILKRKND